AVAEVKLRDDQYTLEHMRAFGMYNYLHCDFWYQDSVYYVDQLGRVLNLTVTLDTALGKPREVFRLPSELNACDNRTCASMYFLSSTWVALSDGTGRLYLMRTGSRGESTTGKWEILFNQELGDPFIIVHGLCSIKPAILSLEVLLLKLEKDELDERGSGFHVSLEWLTVATVNSGDCEKYEILKRRILIGKSVPHYAAIEPDGSGVMIASDKPFRFKQDDGNPVHENQDDKMEEAMKYPIYYWQQTTEDLTITVRLPEGTTKENIQFQLSPDRIKVGIKGQTPLLKGQLYSIVDHENSTWIMKENKSLEISLMKKNEGPMWLEFIIGDKQGQFVADPAQAAVISECLMHLTAEEM
uniref:NudC domain-containing protein 1 n=1 Tax=Latimeria chalumnae TaxID=7897 RepID=H3AMR4_LATCH